MFPANATNKTTNNNCLAVITIIILECTAPTISAPSVLAGVCKVVFLVATLWLFPAMGEVAGLALVRLRLVVLRQTGTDRA